MCMCHISVHFKVAYVSSLCTLVCCAVFECLCICVPVYLCEYLGHLHNDHLTFQMFARGAMFIGDPGYALEDIPLLYAYRYQPIGHSCILVDTVGPVTNLLSRLVSRNEGTGVGVNGIAGGTGYGVTCGEAGPSYMPLWVTYVGRCVLMHPRGWAVLFDRVSVAMCASCI